MENYPKVELNERYRKKNTFSFPSHRDDFVYFLPMQSNAQSLFLQNYLKLKPSSKTHFPIKNHIARDDTNKTE